ncbi:hypothetical protein J6590_055869 [Homalodisca vitripennis]|nr:hypothetical protein J6590_055869 [Homalodisca vitripennis]
MCRFLFVFDESNVLFSCPDLECQQVISGIISGLQRKQSVVVAINTRLWHLPDLRSVLQTESRYVINRAHIDPTCGQRPHHATLLCSHFSRVCLPQHNFLDDDRKQ